LLSQFIQLACAWEATARKAGNVHPSASFADLTYTDFLVSARAVAPVLAQAPEQSLGDNIFSAVRATRRVVSSNTNLGIILLLAPLAKAEIPRRDIHRVLTETTVSDARLVYDAIRLAQPGGMGKVPEQDISAAPTKKLREVMALASDRDMIARQYVDDFHEVLEEGVFDLTDGFMRFGNVEAAIIACQLGWLANHPDSLIVRKRGLPEAEEVMRRAKSINELGLDSPEGRSAYAELDRWLRAEGNARNPGTTADLVTACLFVALQEHRMEVTSPFPWDELTL
jgi:triphosphoribosyl-dephospho-CoA synthase